jgi:acetyl-CoA acyltransferase
MMQDGTQNTNRLVNKTARERFPGLYFPMGVTAEIVAERYKVSREDQDKYALQSQKRYAAAFDKGWVSEEIVPMKVRRKVSKKGAEPYEECGRDATSAPRRHHAQGLAWLAPVFAAE